MEDLFGKYCYIDTPWIAGAKTRYRILGGGCESTPVCHDSWEKVVFVVLDTLVSDDSIIRRFALKDIEVIEEDELQTNADKFRKMFGIYATELWAMPEAKFLEWLNAERSEK